MQVKKIPSFGRIIKINSDSDKKQPNNRTDSSTYEICKILNSEHTSKYSKEQVKSIRDFFKSVLGDYNGENGILFKTCDNGDTLLISGKEASRVKKWQKNESHLGEKKVKKLVDELIGKVKEPEFSIDFITGHKTKSGFSIFNKFIYGKTKLTYGTRIDGTIQPNNESSNKKVLCSIAYEEKRLEI